MLKPNLRQETLSIALSYCGYAEKLDNNNIFGDYFGHNYEPWCYWFVSYCLIKAGVKIVPCGYVPTGYNWYLNKNRIISPPVPGDLVFFDFNKDGIPEHIGFFLSSTKSDITFNSIEGNTPKMYGSKSFGDFVYKKVRRYSDVLGFGHINY